MPGWIYILVLVAVLAAVIWVVFIRGDREVAGGADPPPVPCGENVCGRKRGKTRLPEIDQDEIVEIQVQMPRKQVKRWLQRFRSTKECRVVNEQGLCTEVIEYYRRLYQDLVSEDKSNAGKVIIQRHFVPQCIYCKDSQPVWAMVMNEYLNGGTNQSYIFLENDENTKRTPGIVEVPTYIRFDGKRICQFNKGSDYEKLKKFIEG